jgi:hypothetical protein
MPTATTSTTTVTTLQGPTDIMLNQTLQFSRASGTGEANGATIQLSTATIEQNVTSTFQHTLFIVDSNDNITVYPNGSSTPIQAQSEQTTSGSTHITYTYITKTGSSTFNGNLTGNQMAATYASEFIGGAVVNGQTFSGGNTSSSTFTTQVQWISSDQKILSPPSGT